MAIKINERIVKDMNMVNEKRSREQNKHKHQQVVQMICETMSRVKKPNWIPMSYKQA